jgi:hypothetical protein
MAADDDEVGSKPDEKAKAAQSTKKTRAKGKQAGAKPNSDTESGGEVQDGGDTDSEEESVHQEDTIASSPAPEPAAAEPPKGSKDSPAAPPETKPKSTIHLLRFERRVGKRRR